MFCLYCGAQNPDDAVFCRQCGKQQHGVTSSQATGPVNSPETPFPETSIGSEQSPGKQLPMEQATLPASSPPLPSSQYQPPSMLAQKKSQRGRWMVLSIIGIVILLLVAGGGFVYANRSTPSKTLDTVCNAVKNDNFPTVYSQFSTTLKRRLGPEPSWASGRQQDYNSQGRLTNCTVSSVNESSSSASGIVTLSFGNGRSEKDRVGLLNENGSWLIHETAMQTAGGSIIEFALPTANSGPFSIVAGPDGNLWFTESDGNKIGRISSSGSISESSGSISEFALPTASGPFSIAVGPDGNLWFTEAKSDKIGRISSSGSISEFALPAADSRPFGIAASPDGNLWFTEASGNKIGRISSSGSISEFALPTATSGPEDIVAGPDGNLWFTEQIGNKIGHISSSGSISEFALPTANSSPIDIVAGPDGNLWFTERDSNKIGRISSSGSIREFALPSANSVPLDIAAGPDGNLWFTEYYGNKIGRISSR